ncbi:MAG: hypothetical protein WDA24_08470 [Tissierellales bacterium]
MRLLIHDLENEEFQRIFPNPLDETMIISNSDSIHNCIGCFGCWVKTPAACLIRDEYGDMGEHMSKCNELIIISKCCYGGYSPFIKNVVDRSIPYVHPYFVIESGEMHHRRRYKNHIDLKVCFYGENITEKEKETAEKLVKANSINLHCSVSNISFKHCISEMEGLIL